MADFSFEGAQIYWNGKAIKAFEVHGAIVAVYKNQGGSGSWLGFPVSDEYSDDVPGRYRRSDFEGGYITWEASISGYRPFDY